jgi:ribosomal protein S18 acetylase RimI-like enzyme
MPHHLPTISRNAAVTPDDLVRFYHRVELHWSRHLAEETTLDIGTALANPRLRAIDRANCIFDATLPEGMSPSQAIEIADAHFQEAASQCRMWIMNPSASRQVDPLLAHLVARGFQANRRDILYLAGHAAALDEIAGLTIIPARASFRHVRELAEEISPDTPGAADAALMHLDDPHVDALLALRQGTALGFVTVLSTGEIGAITELFVSAAYRRHGIGRTLLARAMEIAARSLFKHVFVSASPDDVAATSLLHAAGFTTVGTFTEYRLPPSPAAS